MTVYLRPKVNVRAWREIEQKNILFAPDDKLAEYVISNMRHASGGEITIENGTDMDLPFPDIDTVRGVYIQSDQDILITLNGGQQESLEKADVGTTDAPTYCRFFFEGEITSLNIEKADSTPDADANVLFFCWGDPES